MFYHASSVNGIMVLKPQISQHGKPFVYFSKKRENVLVYLSNAVEKYCKETCYFYDRKYAKWGPYGFGKDGLLCLEEYYPNALVSTYQGVSGYIYSVENIPEGEYLAEIPDAVISSEPVPVSNTEYVADAYEAILQAEKDGLIHIVRYEEQSETKKKWVEETVLREYEEAADHPEYRHFLTGMFPDIFAAVLKERSNIIVKQMETDS